MESNRRRRRPKPRRRDNNNKPKSSPKPKPTVESSSRIGGVTSSSTVHDVPDHVLEVILLGLDSHVSLVRAASACKRWCRVVADAGFLSRFHPVPAAAPLILGHYYHHHASDDVVFVPSSSTPPSVLERSSRQRQSCFSLHFVPKLDGACWEIADSRDTLLLLSKKELWTTSRSSSSFSNPDLVVCRPLTRRYQAISSVPDRLAGRQCLGLFLVEGGGGGTGRSIGLSNFRVIAVLLRDHMVVPGRGVPEACVYYPGTRTESRCGWRDVSCTWSGGDINIPIEQGRLLLLRGARQWLSLLGYSRRPRRRAGSRRGHHGGSRSLISRWPSIFGTRSRCFRVVGGGEDGAVSLRAVHLMGNDLRVYARLHAGDEWVLQNLLPLPRPENARGHWSPRNAMVVAALGTYVLVTPRDSMRLFSVDLKTMAVELVMHKIMNYEGSAYPYELPWPPTLDFEAAADNSNPNTTSD